MRNEQEFKSFFRKSVRAQKGFSIALAAPMINGIPDMYVIIPGYLPLLLEAKWLGEVNKDTFKRKVPITAVQDLWLGECHNVVPYSAMGLVGLIYNGKRTAVLVAHGTEQYSTLTHEFVDKCAFSAIDKGELFEVGSMLAKVPIPKINGALNGKLIKKDANDDAGTDKIVVAA